MSDRLVIELPLPPKELSPNARVHWARKAKRTRAYRDEANLRTRAASVHLRKLPWPRATAHLTFYWPDKRRRDVRNAEHAMKAAYDGIVDAGVIPDDDANTLRHIPTDFELDATNPRVVVELTEQGQ